MFRELFAKVLLTKDEYKLLQLAKDVEATAGKLRKKIAKGQCYLSLQGNDRLEKSLLKILLEQQDIASKIVRDMDVAPKTEVKA